MNVKYDLDRKRFPPKPFQAPGYQNYPSYPRPYPNYLPQNPPMNQVPNSEQIVGNKPCNILVRELWLGGIP